MWSKEYKSAEPWPADNINLSLFIQFEFLGLKFIISEKSVNVIGAVSKGIPGWPELALSIASTDNILII